MHEDATGTPRDFAAGLCRNEDIGRSHVERCGSHVRDPEFTAAASEPAGAAAVSGRAGAGRSATGAGYAYASRPLGRYWIQLVPKDLPLLCQPEDLQKMEAVHFVNASAVHDTKHWSDICIQRTPAQHGSGEMARAMAPSSGYMLSCEGEPTLYIAGDTIWYDQVAETIKEHNPQIIVVNAGAAQFLHGDPITMTAGDVVRVCRAAPQAQVIAVHMEAINHCLLTRAELAEQAQSAGARPVIPEDGARVELHGA